jgi:hypothetical protein
MELKERKRKITTLWILIFLGLVYCALIYIHLAFTQTPQIDGLFGVLLGLFTSAHPAANLLDIILYGRYISSRNFSKQSTYWFWTLNIIVLLVGWVDIVMGLLRFSFLK